MDQSIYLVLPVQGVSMCLITKVSDKQLFFHVTKLNTIITMDHSVTFVVEEKKGQ